MLTRTLVALLVALACFPARASAVSFVGAPSFGETKVGAEASATVVAVADYPGGQPDELMGAAGLGGAAAGDYAITANTCSNVHVRTACRITVAFRPTAAGAREATLSLAGQYGNAQVALSATGFVTGRAITVQPPSAFPAVPPGELSGSAVAVTNAGDLSLSVVALMLRGDAAPLFSFGSENCLGGPLAPGASCSTRLTFWAPFPGRFSAQLDVSCAPECAPASVALDASAASPPTGPPPPVGTPTPGTFNTPDPWTLDLVQVRRTRTGIVAIITSYPRQFVTIQVYEGNHLRGVRRPSVLGKNQPFAVSVSLRRSHTYTVKVSAIKGSKTLADRTKIKA